jgi:hypothetical protein
MGYWLKSYTDILDDPKYFRLSTNAQLAMHECFLIAKKLEGVEMTGLLPDLEEIAFHSRKPIEFWTEAMKELIDIGIVIENQLGYLIKNYVKRQKPIPQDERMRQYRKKKNNGLMDENDDATERSENETNCNGEKRREEESKSKRREEVDVEDIKNNDDNVSIKKLLIDVFSYETSIPINKNMSLDDKISLDSMISAGVNEDDLIGAIEYMNKNGFPIIGMKSILKPAIVEHGKRNTKDKKEDYSQYSNGKYKKFLRNNE